MSRVTTADGVGYALHVRGAGPAVVLLHGFASSSATWDGVAERLGEGRRLVAIDLLGHGGSDAPPPERQAVELQARDLASIIGRLTSAPVTLVGYSFGARVALWLAVTAPDLVECLVLESPSAGLLSADARAARVDADERWAALLDAGDMGAFHDAWEAQPLFRSRAGLPAAVRAAIRTTHLAADGRGLARSLRGAGQGVMPPLHDHLPEIRQPALVLAGELDRAGCERAEEVASRLPGARLAVVEGAGHAPHLERPDTFVRATTDFLAAVAVTTSGGGS